MVMVMRINNKQSYRGGKIQILKLPFLPLEWVTEINTPLLRRGYHKLPTENQVFVKCCSHEVEYSPLEVGKAQRISKASTCISVLKQEIKSKSIHKAKSTNTQKTCLINEGLKKCNLSYPEEG